MKKGNLTDDSPLATDIPSLMSLKKSLYCQEFRSFMETITGLEPGVLTEQVSFYFHPIDFFHSLEHTSQFDCDIKF